MTYNYKTYNYSLNPLVLYKNKYHDCIYKLWLQFWAKTFYSIPFSQKMNYFDQLLQFLKNKYNSIDDNTLTMLFNIIYKYGDRNMNQEFFVFLRKKTYTSFLCLREKTKAKNNFIDYRLGSENNIYNQGISYQKDKPFYGKFNFIVNSFCTKIKEKEENDKNNENSESDICNEPFIDELSTLYDEQENFIQFECNKCGKKQSVIVSCFYEKNDDLKYQINFKLISPSAILRQKWFKDKDKINLFYMQREYIECYLSALFFFHQQGLVFDFLLPQTILDKELLVENNDKINNKKDMQAHAIILENNEKKNEDKKGHIKVLSNTLDLGDQNVTFFAREPGKKNDLINKTHDIKNKSTSTKKKSTKTINCSEFKANSEKKK